MDNHVADALSRATFTVVQESLDYDAMTAFQKDDPEIRAYHTAISGLLLEDISFGAQGAILLCDVSTGHPRPIVPAGWRYKVFDHIHGLSHLSMHAQESSWRQSSSGMVYISRWVSGLKPASLAKLPRSSNTLKHHLKHSVPLSVVLTTLMLI